MTEMSADIQWAIERNAETSRARGEALPAAASAQRPAREVNPAALEALAAAGTGTNARVNLSPLTLVMRGAIRRAYHLDGMVSVESAGGPRTVRGIADRGYGEPTYRTVGRRRIITGLQLNRRGMELGAQLASKAA